jgi:hypothetical protein
MLMSLIHFVAATGELVAINRKLEVIQKKLEQLGLENHFATIGAARWVGEALDDIEAELLNTGRFTADMMNRLNHIEAALGPARHANRLHVELERERVRSIHADRAGDAAAARKLIVEEGAQLNQKLHAATVLAEADIRVQQARIAAAAHHSPGDLERRIKVAEETLEQSRTWIDEYRSSLQSLEELGKSLGAEAHALRSDQELEARLRWAGRRSSGRLPVNP